jgi:hypothetical protein
MVFPDFLLEINQFPHSLTSSYFQLHWILSILLIFAILTVLVKLFVTVTNINLHWFIVLEGLVHISWLYCFWAMVRQNIMVNRCEGIQEWAWYKISFKNSYLLHAKRPHLLHCATFQ